MKSVSRRKPGPIPRPFSSTDSLMYYVYLLASRKNGTLYVGVTNDLAKRVSEHRTGTGSRFSRDYSVTKLMWFQSHDDLESARGHERRLKRWRRDWKIALIEADNPHWLDLFPTLEPRAF